MTILVVDDSRIVRRTICYTVKELGFTPVEAENGADALAKLRKYGAGISLIILDWNMPVMDGYQVLVKIRASAEFNSIPVLMATSDGVQEDVETALKAGANDYLVKPFTKKDIAARITNLIGNALPVKHDH